LDDFDDSKTETSHLLAALRTIASLFIQTTTEEFYQYAFDQSASADPRRSASVLIFAANTGVQ
jgi:hypothetical protein